MVLSRFLKDISIKRYEKQLRNIIALQQRHNIHTDDKFIKDAFYFALRIHEAQKRLDGRDYIVHPLAVAYKCAEYWLDDVSIASALLHDTVEDAGKIGNISLTSHDIEKEFGKDVASIVEGVTKLSSSDYDPSRRRIETLKKLLLSTVAQDIRTLIIKIFDRHDNVRTIGAFKRLKNGRKKQEVYDYETRRFYIPIAGRLGLYKLAREMEDNLMRVLSNDIYVFIKRWVEKKQGRIKPQINNVMEQIKFTLESEGIGCREKFYHKGIYQIYEQLKGKKIGLDHLDEVTLYNLTLIVPTEDECYRTIGIVHRLFPHMRDSVYDFINSPKVNGYQSLHTIILVPGVPKLQILIRTHEMDLRNHLGFISNLRSDKEEARKELRKWIDDLVSSIDEISPQEFVDLTSKVIFEEIEVITPKGEPVHLPAGSTALDFAFQIHSDVALRAKYVEIDGKKRKLSTVLKKGQKVKIITDDKIQAKPHWFNWIDSSTSRVLLRRHFKKQQRAEIEAEIGRFLDFCKAKLGVRLAEDSPVVESVYKSLGYKMKQEFAEDLYTGSLLYEYVIPHLVMNLSFRECRKMCRMFDEQGIIPHDDARKLIKECSDDEIRERLRGKIDEEIKKKTAFSEYVEIPSLKFPLPVKFARCCHPHPNAEVIAVVSKGKGATIHRRDCVSISYLKEYNSVHLKEARWKKHPRKNKIVIEIEGNDRPNLLHDLTHLFHDVKGNILKINIDVEEGKEYFRGRMVFEVSDVISKDILEQRLKNVRSLKVNRIEMYREQ